MVERPINELCGRADDAYRKTSRHAPPTGTAPDGRARRPPWVGPDPAFGTAGDDIGLALRAAAMHAGEYEAFGRIVVALNWQAPEVAEALGLHD
jgi:hypothetical protein